MTYDEFLELNIGDHVEVISKEELEEIGHDANEYCFEYEMEKYCGQEYIVMGVYPNDLEDNSHVHLSHLETGEPLRADDGWIWKFGYQFIKLVNHEVLPEIKVNFDTLLGV